MRRLAVAIVVACLALAASASAAGTYSDGTYKGKHTQGAGKRLTFKVVSTKTKKGHKRIVKRYVRIRGAFTNVDVTCPDGFVYHTGISSTDTNGKPNNTDIAIKSGHFSLSKPAIPLRFSGHFAGTGSKSHASGQFAYTIFAVSDHGGDCVSGPLKWSAKH
jgi:hypothetical protein